MVDLLAKLPSAAIELGPVSLPAVIAMYLLLFGVTIWAMLPRERRPALPAPSLVAILVALSMFAFLTWKAVVDRPDGRLHLTTFESGGTLIETAQGRFILIGGGDSATALANSLGRRLPLFNRRLDWLVLPDRQFSGLAGVPGGLEIGALMLTDDQLDRVPAALIQALQAGGAELVRAQPGMALELGDGARLELIDDEQGDLTFLLTSGRARIALLPRARSPRAPPRSALSGIILSGTSSVRLLQDLEVTVAVMAGSNPFPFSTAPANLLATEDRGWIELVTDGEHLWVWTQRFGP